MLVLVVVVTIKGVFLLLINECYRCKIHQVSASFDEFGAISALVPALLYFAELAIF